MPCCCMTASSVPRRPRMPPWIFGCRVLTRPSMISGKPVTSETSRAGMPASFSSLWVPPVDSSSTPSPLSARAKSTSPVLSETESRARFMPGRSCPCAGLFFDLVVAQLLAQRGAVQSQHRGGARLVAAAVLQRGAQQRRLDLVEDHAVQVLRRVAVQGLEEPVEAVLDVMAQRLGAVSRFLCGHDPVPQPRRNGAAIIPSSLEKKSAARRNRKPRNACQVLRVTKKSAGP